MTDDMIVCCEFCGAPLDLKAAQVIMVNTPNTLGPLTGIEASDVRWMCMSCKCWNNGEDPHD